MVVDFTIDGEYDLTVLADERLGAGILSYNESKQV
jgi:hypothetical protein